MLTYQSSLIWWVDLLNMTPTTCQWHVRRMIQKCQILAKNTFHFLVLEFLSVILWYFFWHITNCQKCHQQVTDIFTKKWTATMCDTNKMTFQLHFNYWYIYSAKKTQQYLLQLLFCQSSIHFPRMINFYIMHPRNCWWVTSEKEMILSTSVLLTLNVHVILVLDV